MENSALPSSVETNVSRADAQLREAKQTIRLLEQENEKVRLAAAYLSQASPRRE